MCAAYRAILYDNCFWSAACIWNSFGLMAVWKFIWKVVETDLYVKVNYK